MKTHNWSYVKHDYQNGTVKYELTENSIELGIVFADEQSAINAVSILTDYEAKFVEMYERTKHFPSNSQMS